MGWWQRYLDWRHRHVYALELTADGFRFRAGKASEEVRWRAVKQVTAFKRDLLTTDMLCMLILLDDGIVEINEEMIGYAEIEHAMAQAFGLSEEWKLEVLFPAFVTNPTLVYQRSQP